MIVPAGLCLRTAKDLSASAEFDHEQIPVKLCLKYFCRKRPGRWWGYVL